MVRRQLGTLLSRKELKLTHGPEKPNNVRPAPDDLLDAEYRELMKLAGEDGCKCGIPHCPGHEVIGGRVFMDTHPLGRWSSRFRTRAHRPRNRVPTIPARNRLHVERNKGGHDMKAM